jgi:hypothetical protein
MVLNCLDIVFDASELEPPLKINGLMYNSCHIDISRVMPGITGSERDKLSVNEPQVNDNID